MRSPLLLTDYRLSYYELLRLFGPNNREDGEAFIFEDDTYVPPNILPAKGKRAKDGDDSECSEAEEASYIDDEY